MNRSSSMIIADEPYPSQPARRKVSADAFDFSRMDFFATLNSLRSNNFLNVTALAPIRTGSGNFTNFQQLPPQQSQPQPRQPPPHPPAVPAALTVENGIIQNARRSSTSDDDCVIIDLPPQQSQPQQRQTPPHPAVSAALTVENGIIQNAHRSTTSDDDCVIIDVIQEEEEENPDESDDALNRGFIVDDNESDLSNVCNAIRKSIQRRKSLPNFLSINPTVAAASDDHESIQRRNSIDVARSQKSSRSKRQAKVSDALNRAFINDKENDKFEHYDKIVLEEAEINMSDVFEEEEGRESKYDKILYLPKTVDDKNLDYKKMYHQLQQKYYKREERIADVKKLIMEGKSSQEVLQRLNGILTFKDSASSGNDANVHLEQSRPTSVSDTIGDLEKEFEKLKVNLEKKFEN
uniref:Uncharacterized protein n=1 Tax=Panagrolaimus sp. ES5 TaxID=591445 RepID=A0AC34FIS6_9BILA